MASELYVETLKGLTSGANANKVIIPSGQTLEVTDGLRSADMPAGSVLQVVFDNHATQIVISNPDTQTEHDVGLSASITPSSSSSKILVIASVQVQQGSASGQTLYWRTMLKRNGNAIVDNQAAESVAGETNELGLRTTFQWLDQPTTTDTLTYTVAVENDSGAPSNMTINRSGSQATITLMEIAG